MSNNLLDDIGWIFEADDTDLLAAVEKFLDIQGANFQDARRKNKPVSEEAINLYREWVEYWYQLRKGKKLSLSEIRSICGFECVVQIVESAGNKRRYLVQFNPDFSVAGCE